MKFATSVLAIVFIAVPALAISTEQYECVIYLRYLSRSISNLWNRRSYDLAERDVYGREVDEIVDNLTREDLDAIFGRELVNDIEERSPFGIL